MQPPAWLDRLRENVRIVHETIAAATARSGRAAGDVTLVAVTKTVNLEVIRALAELGVADLGESRVQQLVERAMQTSAAPVRWHLVGHLQRNKVRTLLRHARIVHSLDSIRLADELDVEAGRIGAAVDAYCEVNVSGEASKQGVTPGEARELVAEAGRRQHLRIAGLMTMAPFSADAEAARPVFRALRELLAELRAAGAAPPACTGLSMGMSQDYRVAVEEGATCVRVGSALFDGVQKIG